MSDKKQKLLVESCKKWITKAGSLEDENAELQEELNKKTQLIEKMKSVIDNLEKKIEEDGDGSIELALKTQRKEFKKTLESNADKIKTLELQILLKEQKIQSLNDSLVDWKERYKELRDDYREEQRSHREGKKTV